MKSAVVLLAAVTVLFTTTFPECSSIEPKQNGVSDSLRQLVYERIEISEKALDKYINIVDNAVATACNDFKEGLIEVVKFVKGFAVLVAEIHKKLRNFVNSGSLEGRDELVKEIERAIKVTKYAVASFECIPEEVKTATEQLVIGVIVGNGVIVNEKLRKA